MKLPSDPDGLGLYLICFTLPDGSQRSAVVQGRGFALDECEALRAIDVAAGWCWPGPPYAVYFQDSDPATGTIKICGEHDTEWVALTRCRVTLTLASGACQILPVPAFHHDLP